MKNMRVNQGKSFVAQSGFTLTEAMVALVISLFVMMGLMVAFSGNRESYQLNNALLRIQDSGRFALDYIIADLRMAGDIGCVRSALDQEDDFSAIVGRVKVHDDPDFDTGGTYPGSYGLISENMVLGVRWNYDENALYVYGIPVDREAAGKDNAILWSDCQDSQVVFDGTAPSGQSYQTPTGLRKYTYHANEKILTVVDPATGLDADPPPTLLENVERFVVCFGLAELEDPSQPLSQTNLPIGKVKEWSFMGVDDTTPTPLTPEEEQLVIAVQVQMVVASDPVPAGKEKGKILAADQDAKEYTFCDGSTDEIGGDRRLYKFFSSTAVLRNKVPNGYGAGGGTPPLPDPS